MLSLTPPCSVNLNAFDSRFLSTCCRRLESVVMLRSSFGSICTSKARRWLSALVPERPDDSILQSDKKHFLGVDGDRAGLDFREIENIADQVHQIGAGTVDRAGELDLPRRQVAVRVFAELLA